MIGKKASDLNRWLFFMRITPGLPCLQLEFF